MEFEWDASKEAENLRKHKVSFAEAVESMRKPRMRDLKVDGAGTRKLRAEMARQGTVKITINVDADSLGKLKELSAESGVPYQRLLNSVLRERLSRTSSVHARLDRIERELKRVKKTLAA